MVGSIDIRMVNQIIQTLSIFFLVSKAMRKEEHALYCEVLSYKVSQRIFGGLDVILKFLSIAGVERCSLV